MSTGARLRATRDTYALRIVKLLAKNGHMPMSEVTRAMHTSLPVISKVVMRLEKRGLVDKVGDPFDGRRIDLSVTDRGRDLLLRK